MQVFGAFINASVSATQQIEQGLLRMGEFHFAIPTVTIIYQQGDWLQNKYTNILMPYCY